MNRRALKEKTAEENLFFVKIFKLDDKIRFVYQRMLQLARIHASNSLRFASNPMSFVDESLLGDIG